MKHSAPSFNNNEPLKFKLDDFEGPIDLLLHLVIKNKMDIKNIPILSLLGQYLSFLDESATLNSDISSDFLAMAARLVYMKSLALLPKNQELIDLQNDLQQMILLYAFYKETANILFDSCFYDNIHTRAEKKFDNLPLYNCIHDKNELFESFLSIINKTQGKKSLTTEEFMPIINTNYISVTTKIISILKYFYKNNSIPFHLLFDAQNKSENISTFLALLELIHSKRIEVNNENQLIFTGKFKK